MKATFFKEEKMYTLLSVVDSFTTGSFIPLAFGTDPFHTRLHFLIIRKVLSFFVHAVKITISPIVESKQDSKLAL